MAEKIELEIVTPEQLLFSGEVEEVVVPGSEGYLGILPGHEIGRASCRERV